jgi:hypothetical protein
MVDVEAIAHIAAHYVVHFAFSTPTVTHILPPDLQRVDFSWMISRWPMKDHLMDRRRENTMTTLRLVGFETSYKHGSILRTKLARPAGR